MIYKLTLSLSLGISAFFLVFFHSYPELLPFEQGILIPISQLSACLFAIPLVVGLGRWIPHAQWWKILIFALYPLMIESFAIITGWPYSRFQYGDILGGPRIFGLVPWTVSLSWMPIFFLALMYTARYPKWWQKTIGVAIGMTVFDLVLDPGATALGMWVWENPGWYFGVPSQNFFGWIVTSALAYILWDRLFPSLPEPTDDIQKLVLASGLISGIFWIWVGVWLVIF